MQRVASRQNLWSLDECTGELRSATVGVVRLIPAPLNPDRPRDGMFYLYYFVRLPDGKNRAEKTVLFCGGGPGDKAMPDDSEFWLKSLPSKAFGFNVVYFHLRGTGFSQVPPSNDFDKFLRTKFAVNDLEKIREDFLGADKSWDAVIGYSYGCVLAQQYAASEHGSKMKKLTLIAPPSNHLFRRSDPVRAYKEYENDIKNIRTEIIDKIYGMSALQTVNREEIQEKLFGEGGIYQMIEDNFGSERFVIDAFEDLKESGVMENDDFGLAGYRRDFFQALRELRHTGWSPILTPGGKEKLQGIGKRIADGLKRRENGRPMLAEPVRSRSRAEHLDRAFYVISTYDGINRRFLKEWLAGGKKNFAGALARTGGKAHLTNGVNKHLGKVGISSADVRSIKPWNPADYRHNRPTLILNGGADVVTAAGQAEYYYNSALIGYRVMLTFAGVGHNFILPAVNPPSPILDEACQRGNVNPIDCVISSFILMPPKQFYSAASVLFIALEKEGGVVAH